MASIFLDIKNEQKMTQQKLSELFTTQQEQLSKLITTQQEQQQLNESAARWELPFRNSTLGNLDLSSLNLSSDVSSTSTTPLPPFSPIRPIPFNSPSSQGTLDVSLTTRGSTPSSTVINALPFNFGRNRIMLPPMEPVLRTDAEDTKQPLDSTFSSTNQSLASIPGSPTTNTSVGTVSSSPPPLRTSPIVTEWQQMNVILPILESKTLAEAKEEAKKVGIELGPYGIDENQAWRALFKRFFSPRSSVTEGRADALPFSILVVNFWNYFAGLLDTLPKLVINSSGTNASFIPARLIPNVTKEVIQEFLTDYKAHLAGPASLDERLELIQIILQKSPWYNEEIFSRSQFGSGNDIVDAIPMARLIADSFNTKKRRKRNQQIKANVDRLMEKGVITKRKQYKHGHMGRRKKRRKTQSLTQLLD